MRAVFQQTGVIPLLQMHDALECSVTSREQAETIARLGEEAVSLNVPMIVDIKIGKSWGEATRAKKVERIFRPAHVTPPKPEAVPPLKSAIIVPPKPAIAIPLPPRPTIAPAIAAPPEITVPPPLDDTEIDLADLVDCQVPKSRMILCPLHGETRPSMRIYPDHYYCFGCGACGDHVDWLVRVEGLEYGQARDIVDNWDGPVVPRSNGRDAEEDAPRTAYALTWWGAAKPIRGTLAARYLADTRGIDLDALPDNVDDVLRFHSNCVFGPGIRHPCLLALMRNPVSGQATGIQRTALTSDARKIDRRMLGVAGVVQLWPADRQLVIGEGLETTLAAATRLDYRGALLRPAWAMLSDRALARFPVIDGVERLILLVDHDHNHAGQTAANECKQCWQQAGCRGVLLMPDHPGTDFNDVVLEHLRCAS